MKFNTNDDFEFVQLVTVPVLDSTSVMGQMLLSAVVIMMVVTVLLIVV